MQESLTFPTLDSPPRRYGASPSHYTDLSEKTSSASTPFVSAPSSPGRMGTPGFYFSAPTSPYWGHRIEMHDDAAAAYTARRDYPSAIPFSWEEKPGTPKRSYDSKGKEDPNSFLHSSDFEFSARFSELDDPSMSPTPMSSANELFCNGQIRPLRIPPRLEQPFSLRQCIHESASGYPVRPYEVSRGPVPCIASLSAPQSPRSLLSSVRGSGVFEHSRGSPSLSAPQSPRSPLKEAPCNIKEAPSPSGKALDGTGMAASSSSGHRRTRSFSPLRMFYREAAPSKACFVDAQAVLSRESSVGENTHGDEASCSQQKASRRWTLKDLLHRRSGGENRSNSSRANSRRSSSSSMESSSRGSSHYTCSFSSMDVFAKESHGKNNNNRVKSAASSRSSTHRGTPCATSTTTISCSSCSSSNCSSRATNKGSVSPHELHYMMQKAHAEELRKKTFLPYRQGLLGCLGFSSRSYRTVSNISKTLQSVSG